MNEFLFRLSELLLGIKGISRNVNCKIYPGKSMWNSSCNLKTVGKTLKIAEKTNPIELKRRKECWIKLLKIEGKQNLRKWRKKFLQSRKYQTNLLNLKKGL